MLTTKYVITNKDETEFYPEDGFACSDILLAKWFYNMESANYYIKTALNSFQTKRFTKVVEIEISITINPRKKTFSIY